MPIFFQLIKNAQTYPFVTDGIPYAYYGSEQVSNQESLLLTIDVLTAAICAGLHRRRGRLPQP